MGVKIRLSRFGRRGIPVYRVVVVDKESPRDGKTLEIIGQYDPRSKTQVLNIKKERFDHWISKGAKCTDTVRNLVKKIKA